MTKRTKLFLFYFLLLLVSCYLFLSGVLNLSRTFLGLEVPIGSLLAWSILIFLPTVIFYGNKSIYNPVRKFHFYYRNILYFIIALAVLWLFIGYGFAGNWQFNFKEQEAFVGSSRAAACFLYLTIGIVVVPVLTGIALRIHTIIIGILNPS